MRLYLNEYPRTFVVADSQFSLIIRHPNPQYSLHEHSHRHAHIHLEGRKAKEARSKNKSGQNKVMVEFVRTEALTLKGFSDITPGRTREKVLTGFLGFLNVKGQIFLGFITRSTKVASPKLGENIHMIDSVDFFCLNSDHYDGWINKEDEVHSGASSEEVELVQTGYPAGSVKRFLSLGNFYFSKNFDVTTTMQERGSPTSLSHAFNSSDSYFSRFMWNSYMGLELLEFRSTLSLQERESFDSAGFLITIMRGYAKSVNLKFLDRENALVTLISKQSCKKKGPLFGEWGCDEAGAVSNFVESEVIIYTESFCLSYVILRGNVPSFWELQSNFSKKSLLSSKKSKKVVFTRSSEASQHAFIRHFNDLGKTYGDIHVVNCLLQDPHTYKGELNKNFKSLLDAAIKSKDECNGDLPDAAVMQQTPTNNYKLSYTDMPISTSYMKKVGYSTINPADVVGPLNNAVIDFGAMFYDLKRYSYIGRQLGVMRVNSFDCLSKANFVSKAICQEVIELALRDMNIKAPHDLYIQHAKLWSENDDVLKHLTLNYQANMTKIQNSKSSAAKHSLKQQLTWKYMNVVGEVKQSDVAMLKLLGRLEDQDGVVLYNPFHQYVSLELKKRSSEFSYSKEIKIFASTFNVNGDVSHDDNLREWIFPSKHDVDKDYDIIFIGFEEIIELTAGNMMNVKSDNFIAWEKEIKKILEELKYTKEKYVSLWSWQMGGIAVLLFIKESHVSNISDIEGSVKKTGLGGMSANKGGIGISLTYAKTLLCFVCSHLATGFSNIDERHQDYKTIAKGILFSKRKKIKDHEGVIWLGDFNYRIDLQNEHVKNLIKAGSFQKLFEYDQLNRQMASGESFPFFNEMEITFPPTYKFDNNTKVYDTSEKQRIPAWTDRILSMSKGETLKQEVYDCEEDVIFSDHRPVYAIFKASVAMINETAKKEITHDIYESYKKDVGDINVLITSSDISQFVDDKNSDDMPPPSSDAKKWWLEKGAAAKVSIPELENTPPEGENAMVINPRFPINPFVPTDEPEFIRKADLLKLVESKS